jgi:hypothetical protein
VGVTLNATIVLRSLKLSILLTLLSCALSSCNVSDQAEKSDIEILLHAYGLPGFDLVCAEEPSGCDTLRDCRTQADKTIFLKMKGRFEIGVYADEVSKNAIRSEDLEICAQHYKGDRGKLSIGLLKDDAPAYWAGSGRQPVLSYIMYSEEEEVLCLTYYRGCQSGS